MKGYSRSVDVWSVGCITFLLLRGALPFDAKTKEEIIANTLHRKVHFDRKWDHISIEARSFVTQLLQKDPAKRLTLEDAVKHKWFAPLRPVPVPRFARSPSTPSQPTLVAAHSIAVTATSAHVASSNGAAMSASSFVIASSAKSSASPVATSVLPTSSGNRLSVSTSANSSPVKPSLATQKPPSTFAKRGSVVNPVSPEMRHRAGSLARNKASTNPTSPLPASHFPARPALKTSTSTYTHQKRPKTPKSASSSPKARRNSSAAATAVALLRRRSSSSPEVPSSPAAAATKTTARVAGRLSFSKVKLQKS